MKKIILYITAIVLFASCDRFLEFGGEEVLDEYDLKITPQLVIQGMIVDEDTLQTVRLSLTKILNGKADNTAVSDALVLVSTGDEVIHYEYVDSLKLYAANFKAEPHVEYTLEVTWQEQKYIARESLADLQHFEIDSIEIRKANYDITHWRYFDQETPFRDYNGQPIVIATDPSRTIQDTLLGNEPIEHNVVYVDPQSHEFLEEYQYGDLGEFWFGAEPYIINAAQSGEMMNVYKIYMYAKESKVESNYYRFDVKRKGNSWLQPGQLIIADDFALEENIDGIEFPGYFVDGDEVEFIMYGISRRAYNFYLSLQSVLQNDGGNFSSIPGNPPTNIYDEEGNPGLGYFEVNRVARVKKVVKSE